MRRIINHILTGEPVCQPGPNADNTAFHSYITSMAQTNSILSILRDNEINDNMITKPRHPVGLFGLDPDPLAPRITLYMNSMVRTGGAKDSGQGDTSRPATTDECREWISGHTDQAISNAYRISRFARGIERSLVVDPTHLWRPIHIRYSVNPFACPLPDPSNNDDTLAEQRKAILHCRWVASLSCFHQKMEYLMACLFAIDKARNEAGLSSVDGSNIFNENADLVADYAYLCSIYHEYCSVSIPRARVWNKAAVEENRLSRDLDSTSDLLGAISI